MDQSQDTQSQDTQSQDAHNRDTHSRDGAERSPDHHDPPSMDHRQERVRIETSRHRIEGSLTLARDGYRSRVSDVLNASEREFLTLTDATVQPLEGGPLELHPFLVIARRQIVFAVSAQEPDATQELEAT